MKAARVLFSVLSVLTLLAWFGWHNLQSLASAFQSQYAAAEDVPWVFIVVGLATGACVVGAFIVPASAGRFVALAPLPLILVAQVFISGREESNLKAYEREREAYRAAQERKLDGVSRDFLFQNPKPSLDEYKLSFLTHDRVPGVLVRIDLGHWGAITTTAIGKIDGAYLDALERGAEFEKRYRRFVDGEGKSLFDRYTVRHRPDQDLKVYRLERFGN